MNLAIEYLVRTKIVQDMLKMPCSLLLDCVSDPNKKLVVTIQNSYGKPKELTVKHWLLDQTSKNQVLPPCKEFVVPRNDLYASQFVIVDDFKLLVYDADPYRIHPRQNSDDHYGSIQEKQFNDCMANFYNCVPNNKKRINWLWGVFIKAFFPDSAKSDFGSLGFDAQRDLIEGFCTIPWRGWRMWCKHIMLNTPGTAAELAFATAYADKLKDNQQHQEQLRKSNEMVNSLKYYFHPSWSTTGWSTTAITASASTSTTAAVFITMPSSTSNI